LQKKEQFQKKFGLTYLQSEDYLKAYNSIEALLKEVFPRLKHQSWMIEDHALLLLEAMTQKKFRKEFRRGHSPSYRIFTEKCLRSVGNNSPSGINQGFLYLAKGALFGL
jgi:hypothetical protein